MAGIWKLKPRGLREMRDSSPDAQAGRVIVNESGPERRFMAGELRVIDGDDGPRIRGYGAVFNAWSEDLGWFREMVEPGAFSKTLQEADIRSLWNHDVNHVLARNQSGTLRLFTDDVGLVYEAMPPDAQWARDLMESIKRGDVSGSSFGFDTVKDRWTQDEEERLWRHLVEVKLYDVGPVTFPAYPQTSSEVRKRIEELVSQEGGHDTDGAESEPIQGDHSGNDDGGASTRARLDIRRRRLDLMDQEYLGG